MSSTSHAHGCVAEYAVDCPLQNRQGRGQRTLNDSGTVLKSHIIQSSSYFLTVFVVLQTGIETLNPVVTDEDGLAIISVGQGQPEESPNQEYKEYAASAQTADGKLMVVDMRTAESTGTSPVSSPEWELIVDRTVVGLGARQQVPASDHHSVAYR